jgi:hypothetical protein
MWKKTLKPRIDLDNPKYENFKWSVLLHHPEIFVPAITREVILNIVDSLLMEKFGIGLSITDRECLIPRPQAPNTQKGKKNFKPEDWDAWFYYYVTMQKYGIPVDEGDIATLADRSPNTVEANFKKVVRRTKAKNYPLFDEKDKPPKNLNGIIKWVEAKIQKSLPPNKLLIPDILIKEIAKQLKVKIAIENDISEAINPSRRSIYEAARMGLPELRDSENLPPYAANYKRNLTGPPKD